MAKWANDTVMDNGLNQIKTNVIKMICCENDPSGGGTNSPAVGYTKATVDYYLGDVSMSNLDFTLEDGDSTGRKIIVSAKSSILVTKTQTFNHIALVTGSSLYYVTSVTNPQQVYAGNTISVPLWTITIADPT